MKTKTATAPAAQAPAVIDTPRPPGGGSWRWDDEAAAWIDTSPKPAEPDVDKPNPTEQQ